MIRIFLLLGLVLTVSGCATRGYTAFTEVEFSPKAKDYKVPIWVNNPYAEFEDDYQVIGEVNYRIDARGIEAWRTELKTRASKIARKVGADAIIDWSIQIEEKSGTIYKPGFTSYNPMTTTSKGVANAVGSGGFAAANYSGQSTTMVPQYNPPETVPYYKGIVYFNGRFIVFNPASRERLATVKGISTTGLEKYCPYCHTDSKQQDQKCYRCGYLF